MRSYNIDEMDIRKAKKIYTKPDASGKAELLGYAVICNNKRALVHWKNGKSKVRFIDEILKYYENPQELLHITT